MGMLQVPRLGLFYFSKIELEVDGDGYISQFPERRCCILKERRGASRVLSCFSANEACHNTFRKRGPHAHTVTYPKIKLTIRAEELRSLAAVRIVGCKV